MKNQVKKSLSLIMAVLMLMSCWVWVAPTEAEAATQDYNVKVKFSVRNECEEGGHIKIHYWNFNANGTVNTGSGGSVNLVSSFKDSEYAVGTTETVFEKSTTVPGFPYKVEVYAQGGSFGEGKVAINAITIGDRVVSGNLDAIETHDETKNFGINSSGNAEGNWEDVTIDWPFPKFGLDESNSDASLDITSVPGSATASFAFMDVNYNTPWPHTITQNTPSVVFQKDGVAKTGMSAARVGANSVETKVTASTGADNHNPGNSDSSWTLKASFSSGGVTVYPTVDVSLTHPEYTISFDGNGGKLDASDAGDIKGVYGTKIGHYPTMYDYKGFQLSGYSTSKTGGTILAEDAFKDTLITGNQTYYARWEPKDVDVVFLTADGQTVCTLKAKYGKTLYEHYGSIDAINNAVRDNGTGFSFVGNQLAWIKDGVEYQFAGWRIIDAWDLDENKITTLNGKMYDAADAQLQGKTAFQATYRPNSMKTYTVKFFNTNGEEITESTKTYTYGQAITNLPTGLTLAEDMAFTYEHAGWAKRVGTNSSKYYTVDENGNDVNGSKVLYVSKDIAYFSVEGDAEYVPVFKRTNKEYTITYKYYDNDKVEKSTEVKGVYYGAELEAPEDVIKTYTYGGERFNFSHWEVKSSADATGPKLEDVTCTGNMTVWMTYLTPIPAVYTINFYDMYGNLINKGENENQFTHGATVVEPTCGPTTDGDTSEYDIPYRIDTETSLYTFAGFKTKDGIGVDPTASADVSYYAKYTEQVYANVAFYNEGKLIYERKGKENGYFVNESTIPAYENLVEDEDGNKVNVLPSKAEDAVGTYEFIGWADSSGSTVTPGTSKFTSSNVQLNAQYKTTYKEYTVKFMNGEEVVSEETYHYGDPVAIPEETPTKAEDESYTYTFRAWSPDVSETCTGTVTYVANYRNTPKYYPVTWYKDGGTTPHIESQYTYGARIQQAIMDSPVSYPAAGTGYKWVWKAWIQCNAAGQPIDADGNVVTVPSEITDFEEQLEYICENAVNFARGTKMGTKHLYFYPVFERQADTYTIKFYKEDGTTFVGEITAPHDAIFDDYAEAFKTEAVTEWNDSYHYEFLNWVNLDGTDLPEDGKVSGNVSVKAVCEEVAHTKDIYDIIIDPTCTETGLADVSCSAPGCGKIFKNVVLDVIPDEGLPSGQFYVGAANKWTTDNFKDGIDYSVVNYVSPNTNVIVNAEDTGSRSRNNPDAKLCRGVGQIGYYIHEVTESNTEMDPSGITSWTTIYDYEAIKADVLNDVLEEKGKTMNDYIAMSTPGNVDKKEIDDEVDAILATYNANATGVLSNLSLVNGKTYIIYIKIADREVNGDSNVAYLSSGKISYGSTAPEIAVSGEGYGTKFCADATVTVTDDTDGFKAYLDGAEITLTNGKFICEEKGLHTVTVIDKHGNKTTKTFEIKGNHTYRNYTIAASCEEAGSKYDICTICGNKANEEAIPAIGHSYTANYVDKAPDCVNDGYRTYICDNNCGTKLVLKPTDDAATLAQAKKYVEPEEGEEEGTWEVITAVDLKHLKATGKHTYAMVKDENGEDTEEYVWVIDKAATCTVPGSQHRDCTVCGLLEARVTEEIPLDTKDGHKFYRAQVTKAATCTETGERTKTCRYCGVTELVETLPALGHEAGEYRIIKPATCDEVGSKILTCSRCSTAETPVDIGEPIKDENGNVTGFDGKAVEIAKLGHAWKLEGVPFKAADGKWYQKYVCGNDSSHTKDEVLEDYVEPVAATVTFMNGEAAFATVSGFVGDTISASEVAEKPTKAADATKTYTFSHWATKNADGTYTEVKFPIEVKGDATYYAVYSERFVNYTITYYKEDGTTEFKKTGYLHNGDEVALADGPSKAETKLVKYVFAGWKDINGTETYTDKVTIKGANINLKATYTEVKKQYAVTYAYSKNDILETFAVEAGTEARDCAITPVKVADSKYHYNFKAWNKAEQLKNVESNIYTTPDFESELHSYDYEGGKVLKTEANCTDNAVYTFTCTCGYTFDKEESNTALGHNWGAPVYDSTTGKNTVTCTRENCDVTQEDTRSFSAKFYVEADDTQPIKTISYIPWGTTIDALRLPADPIKESNATTDYTFRGWAIKGTTAAAGIDFTKLEIKQDYEFVAMFTETTREYSVVFAYDAKNVIKTYKNVKAGSSVTFDGAEPTKGCDENYHYSFKGWKGYTEGVLKLKVENIQKDLYILADFTDTKHTYKSFELEAATCTNGTGTRYYCDCNGNGKFDEKVNGEFVDHYYDVTGKPLDHDFVEIDKKEATPNSDGYIKYECKNCGETKEEVLKYADNTVLIRVRVLHNGAAESGVKVEIQNAVDGSVIFATTNKDGYALFTVSKDGVYTCYVEKNGKNQVALELEGSNYVGTYSYTDAADCTCACHRDNLWGAIFRFFHKIIKLFTGEFKCCGNPDPMYG